MQLAAGITLQATSLLDASFFESSTILITEHNEQDSIGFVTNKPLGKTLNELTEFNSSKPFPLYDGGPVESESLFFIHQHPEIIEGSLCIDNDWYYGGSFKQAVAAINDGLVAEKTIKLFIGYCGWDAGELEAEIREGSWAIKH